MSRTLSKVEDVTRDFDFGIVTGDCTDNGQTNENRWVKELLNGEPDVETDSGDDDDPVPGPNNDPKDPFDPFGFPAPWLMVVGNHDLHVVGMLPPDEGQQALALGTSASLGTRDYTQWYAPVTTGTVPADAERIQLSRDDLVDSLWDGPSTPGPLGHGFPEGSDTSVGANWSYDAIPGLLRILSWDSSDPDGGSEGMMLTSTVEGWLLPELERAEEDGVLVIFASHHPSTSVDRKEGQYGSDRDDALDEDEVTALLAEHPQVIAWLAGHEHDRRVRPIAGADADHPGFWEIMTPSLNDWPQQGRTIEIVDNDNGTLSIFATLHDYSRL
jgi:3',5'-cyclic AMP phosphodiesterase CpdA